MKKRKLRNARGAGIIYGCLAVTSILGAAAVGTVVILNIGYGTVYEEKLARVSTIAAQYAAAHSQDGTNESVIKDYTEKLMLSMGLTPTNVAINITRTNSVSGPGVQVTIANQFGLLNTRGLLPTQIVLHDTASAASGTND